MDPKIDAVAGEARNVFSCTVNPTCPDHHGIHSLTKPDKKHGRQRRITTSETWFNISRTSRRFLDFGFFPKVLPDPVNQTM